MPRTLAQAARTESLEAASLRLQHNCRACGFQNIGVDLRCQKCGRRLPPAEATQASWIAGETAQAAPNQQGSPVAVAAASPAELPARPAMPEHVRKKTAQLLMHKK